MFSPNPAGDLAVVNDEGGGVRLLLTRALATEDIRRFGQAPCSAGRRQPRWVCSEGLLGPAANGQCDIKPQDSARINQPSPGQAFVVTCQVSSGEKPQHPVARAIVPPRPLPGEQSSNQAAKVEAAATNPSA